MRGAMVVCVQPLLKCVATDHVLFITLDVTRAVTQ